LNANDGPDALAARLRPLGIALQVGLVLCLFALVYGSFSRGAPWIAASTLVNFLGASFVYWSVYHAPTSQPTLEDLAGRRFRVLVPEALHDHGLVVAPENSGALTRLLYHVNSASPVYLRADGGLLPAEHAGKAWVLAYGVTPTLEGKRSVPLSVVATLLVPTDSTVASEAMQTKAGVVRSRFEFGAGGGITAVGAYAPESWGVWLTPTTTLRFDVPLTGGVRVELWLRGYGPNVGKTITAVLGGARATFEAPRDISKVVLNFGEVTQGEALRFEGLVAASPRAVGESHDDRELALGLSRATVIVEGTR
jgi:hypothetical protein